MRIEHTVDVAAPIERVWELTADVETWSAHTATMERIDLLEQDAVGLGSQARIKQPRQKARVWTVTVFEPPRHFAWATKLAGQTMTGGHHMTASGKGTTLTLTLDIEGRLAPVIGALIKRPIEKALATENAGFKAAAETG